MIETNEKESMTLFHLQRSHWKETTSLKSNILLENIFHIAEQQSRYLRQSYVKEDDGNLCTRKTSSPQFALSDDNKSYIRNILLLSKRKKKVFTEGTLTLEKISKIFESSGNLTELTVNELKEIAKYLNTKENARLSLKGNKPNIIDGFCSFLGIEGNEHKSDASCGKKNSPMTLLQTVRSSMESFGKRYLEITYAKLTWPSKEVEWRNKTTVATCLRIEGFHEVISPTYVPEKIEIGGETMLHIKCLDGHHIRSNIRSKICRGGTKDLKKIAWEEVAKSGSTPLSMAMLDQNKDGKILDQQNDQYIRTMFCKKVEDQLRIMGFKEEAIFTKLLREWHEAEDLPGIPAVQRCLNSLQLRNWLLERYAFGSFPPPGAFVNGIPRITFEDLVCNIEAHLYMYPLSKGNTYNWRSLSTLISESVFGEISEMESHNNGVPTGKSFMRDFSVMSAQNAVRLKPNRSFCMQTAKSRLYPVPELNEDFEDISDVRGNVNSQLIYIDKIIPKDHEFDRRKPRIKYDQTRTIRWPFEQPRGVQPVRSHYKVDESRIFWSSRLRIDTESNKDSNTHVDVLPDC